MMKSIEDLIAPLTQATKDGLVKWEKNNITNFSLSFGEISISVFEFTEPSDGTSGISTMIKDRDDEVLDRFSQSEYDNKYSVLEAFYNAARRSGNRIDNIIENIEETLRRISNKSQ